MSTFVRRLKPAEAAVELRVTTPTVWRWLSEGAPCDRLSSRTTRVNAEELRAWLLVREQSRKLRTSIEWPAEMQGDEGWAEAEAAVMAKVGGRS
jgi:hypothetical protein